MAEKTLEEMRQAVAEIREKMAAAAREAGRDPAAVQLCAACKTRTAQTIAASAALPIDVFGENHVQELCANYDAGAYCGKPSHFIGHLQTNKIKKVLGRASLIQSVDSEHLLLAIEKEAAKAGIVQDILLEVNIGGEESKTGAAPELLWPLLVIAAGVLLVRGDRDKHVLPASALLLACQLRMLFVLRQVAMYSDSGIGSRTPMAALLFGAELMMLLGAVGFTWNRPVGKRSMPLISAIAAALAGANAVWAEVIELDFLVEYFQIGGQGNPGLFRNLITVILLPLGLILVNLAMECREAPPKVWKVDGDKYRRGFSGFVHGFYSDVGGKIQLVAKICGLIYLILGLLGVAVMALSIVILLLQLFGLIPPYFSAASLLLSGLIAVVSALVLAAGTWPLYAFGQMTADVHAIRKEGVASVKTEGAAVPVPDHSAERTNPDELPEL